MISLELFEADRPTVIVERDNEHVGAWSRLQEALVRGVVGGSETRLEVRADVVFSELEVLRELRRAYNVPLTLGPRLKERLGKLAEDRARRETAVTAPAITADEMSALLVRSGFQRTLKSFQLQNLCRLAALPHGADFSVPGAGKTTVALSAFAVTKALHGVERLLVVAPLAAFAAWKEDSQACFGTNFKVAVHLGPDSSIPLTCDLFLTNYHRLAGDYDRLRAWVSERPTHVVLDEAHRIKRGRDGIHGAAVLDLAFSAFRRDVLTGTPAPQGAHDLVAMMKFLYPGQERQLLPPDAFVESLGRRPDVLQATHGTIKKYFVRTCKSDLQLPPTQIRTDRRPMGPVQKAIYSALVGKYIGSLTHNTTDRRSLRDLGLVVMYLLEAATNPLLVTAGSDENDLPAFAHPPLQVPNNTTILDLLKRYSEFERPWKYEAIKDIVSRAAQGGEKVLVWSSFVRNLKFLNRELSGFQPAIVHGGIPPADGAPPSATTTREAELDRFRYDPGCSVLLANPAACGEGVSLHHWCHHAVYLDRTFNAGHFLQSQDRIHRLGLKAGTETTFTFLESEGSIDISVDKRLREKVVALSVLMDDPGLVKVSLPAVDDDDATDDQIFESSDTAIIASHLDAFDKD
ncbi:DEAD/DEAH box helicase [Horticoccus sp. 23ND18S-11]|uniref:DEAD/DEAH box helicase n=1 Tax=Horticoccus sp. 23ND18S-11 TaxID=3391832 RepID=UPI0039C9D88A